MVGARFTHLSQPTGHFWGEMWIALRKCASFGRNVAMHLDKE